MSLSMHRGTLGHLLFIVADRVTYEDFIAYDIKLFNNNNDF